MSLDMLLGNGETLSLEDCGDTLHVRLFDEDGELKDERIWDTDSVAEMLLEE